LLITSEALTVTAVVAGSALAAVVDLRTRRVPNVLTFSLAVLGVAAAATGNVDMNIRSALLGLVVGLTLMLPGHLFGGTGAGDVKLMAALGAWLGPSQVVRAFVYSILVGGALAMAVAVQRRRVGATVRAAASLVTAPSLGREAAGPDSHFCYAPAIAAGSVLAVLGFRAF
jgi:prepilin peptidase CpaA